MATPLRRIAPLALALLAFPAIASAQSVPNGDEILTGEAQESGSDVAWGTARGVVEAPIDHVQAVVHDYAQYNRFLPHFRTSRVLSQRGTSAMVYFEVGVMRDAHTLWAQMRIRARPNRGDTRIVEATLVEGNVDAFAARWELTPLPGNRTLVEFRILVDPDLPLPASVFTNENVKAARKTIRALRRRMNEV